MHKATIVYYHNPTPKVFDKHLRYLSKHYNIITLNCFVEAMRCRNGAELPPRSLVITLDDGYKGNFDLLPILKKYRVVPTIYLCSQIAATNRRFWWKVVDGGTVNHLVQYTNQARLQVLAHRYDFLPTKEYPAKERQALSTEEINVMTGFVDFQAHTRFHPILTKCSLTECEEEIVLAKREVEQLTGKTCKHFSYPRGAYSEREIVLLRKAGYASARTCDVGWNDISTDPYKLKTIPIASDASVNWLAAQLTGIPQRLKPQYLKKILKGSAKSS